MTNCRLNPLIPGVPLLHFKTRPDVCTVEFSDDGSVLFDTGLWSVIPALTLHILNSTRECVYNDLERMGCVITQEDDGKRLVWFVPARAFCDSTGNFFILVKNVNGVIVRRCVVVDRKNI